MLIFSEFFRLNCLHYFPIISLKLIFVKTIIEIKLKSLNFDWQNKIENRPAKKISKDYKEIIKIVEFRIKNNFYSKNFVFHTVTDKILSELKHLLKNK